MPLGRATRSSRPLSPTRPPTSTPRWQRAAMRGCLGAASSGRNSLLRAAATSLRRAQRRIRGREANRGLSRTPLRRRRRPSAHLRQRPRSRRCRRRGPIRRRRRLTAAWLASRTQRRPTPSRTTMPARRRGRRTTPPTSRPTPPPRRAGPTLPPCRPVSPPRRTLARASARARDGAGEAPQRTVARSRRWRRSRLRSRHGPMPLSSGCIASCREFCRGSTSPSRKPRRGSTSSSTRSTRCAPLLATQSDTSSPPSSGSSPASGPPTRAAPSGNGCKSRNASPTTNKRARTAWPIGPRGQF
ncbi:hypothetical protein M885DRAFT_53917 [Pelagophyceae sp. CCMP2097]|nr:hypothetical protein M885DRAFT_53917 [Pelagophyceae sp. CCMP2097]